MTVGDVGGGERRGRQVMAGAGAASIRIGLLGGFRLWRHGALVDDVAWQRRSAKAIVKLLSLQPKRRLHRDELLDTLWPDADPQSSANSFYKALHLARRVFQPELGRRESSAFLVLSNNILQLSRETSAVWIDVEAFVEAGNRAIEAGDLSAAEAALDLYPGELLPEDRYAEWTLRPRERLAERWVDILQIVASARQAAGQLPEAMAALHRALEADPTREDLHRALMRLHLEAGNRDEALRQYQRCRSVLDEEVGAQPDSTTELLRQQIEASPDQPSGPTESMWARARLPALSFPMSDAPLVGRDQTLRDVLEALGDRRPSGSRMLLVSGEPGVGKTRLVMAAMKALADQGRMVLWAESHEQEGAPAYGPLVDALAPMLLERSEAEWPRFLTAFPTLSRLMRPSVAGEALKPDSPLFDDRLAIRAEVIQMLDALSAHKAAVLVLDDLQNADHATLQLIHHLARVSRDHSWFLVATAREDLGRRQERFSRVVSSLRAMGLLQDVRVHLLEEDESQALLERLLPGSPLSPQLVSRLQALSLGNPLFLTELVAMLRESGGLVSEKGVWSLSESQELNPPRRVQELVARRVEGLGPDVQHVLSAASVAGLEVQHEILKAVVEVPPNRFESALDAVLQADVLQVVSGGYRFRHPLVRSSIYELMSASRRRRLHLQIGEVMEAHGGNPADLLAYHFTRSASSEKAVRYLEEAADRAFAHHANDLARSSYADLVFRLRLLHRDREQARALEKLAQVLATMARYQEAIEALEQASRLYEAECLTDERYRTLAALGRVAAVMGRPELGLVRLGPLLTQTEWRPSGVSRAVLGDVYASGSRLEYARGQPLRELAFAERAEQLLAGTEEPTLGEVLVRKGTALVELGRRDEGIEALQHAVSLSSAQNNLTTLCIALNNLTEIQRRGGQLNIARETVLSAQDTARRLGDPARLAMMTCTRGVVEFLRGRWPAARELLREAVGLIRDVDAFWSAAYPLLELGRLELYCDEPDAIRRLEDTLEIARSRADRHVLTEAHCLLAQAAMGRRDLGTAALWLDRLEADESLSADTIAPVTANARAALMLASGNLDEALSLSERSAEVAGLRRDVLSELEAERLRAAALFALGEEVTALDVIEPVAERTAAVGFTQGYARCLWTWGHIQAGGSREGHEHTRRSEELFDRLGSRLDPILLQVCNPNADRQLLISSA